MSARWGVTMSKCRSCGSEIEWVKLKSGKNMPCDPEVLEYGEMEDGDVLVTIDGHVQKVDKGQRFPSLKGYVSHFSTCKDADAWRNK